MPAVARSFRLHTPAISILQITVSLDSWVPDPAVRVRHSRVSSAPPERLWEAARTVRLGDTRMLGRLVRWRIPGMAADVSFDEMFRRPPFMILEEGEEELVAGLVGRIWTLRRDYPELGDPEEFRRWETPGTARVLFANWIDGDALVSETRVQAFGVQGRLGIRAVRPLVGAFQHLIGSDGMEAAIRLAEQEH
jgi:hypothetical protein